MADDGINSTVNLVINFKATGDTPDWSAQEIAQRVQNFLAIELETVVKVRLNGAVVARYSRKAEVEA